MEAPAFRAASTTRGRQVSTETITRSFASASTKWNEAFYLLILGEQRRVRPAGLNADVDELSAVFLLDASRT